MSITIYTTRFSEKCCQKKRGRGHDDEDLTSPRIDQTEV